MQDADVVFSHWVRWADRRSLAGIEFPGVYVLAQFPTGAPDGQANPLAHELVYIGETCKSLKARWFQFDLSAFQGKFGHSGGATYRRLVKDQGQDLFVAAVPVSTADSPVRRTYIRHIERKLLWEYTRQRQKPPQCNSE